MRIAVVTSSYPAHDGDPSGHFVQAEVLDLERQGHTVTVVRPHASSREASLTAFGWPGVASRLREKPLRIVSASAWVAGAAREVARARPDRVIAHWALPAAWPIASLSRNVPLEIVSHGGDVRLLRHLPSAVRVPLVRNLVRRASTWRFVSAALAAELEDALPPDLVRDLRTIQRIVPSPLWMVDVRADVRARRSEVGGRRLYVSAGRLVPSKCVHKVIDYVAGERRHEDRVLVVLGDGPERVRLESMARAWHLDARFLGTTSRRVALGWIGAADEVVHASRAEGLSTVVREARELGVPVTLL